jgi:hypothetical protein
MLLWQKKTWISCRVFVALMVAIGLCLGSGPVFGQVTNGTISGTITDGTGARVSGASISVTNLGTGIVSAATADQNGHYSVPSLVIGTYEESAKKSGFATGLRSGIDLTAGREAVVDIIFKVGIATEQVTVTGDAPLAEITDSTVISCLSF